jgi:hypothetical protein
VGGVATAAPKRYSFSETRVLCAATEASGAERWFVCGKEGENLLVRDSLTCGEPAGGGLEQLSSPLRRMAGPFRDAVHPLFPIEPPEEAVLSRATPGMGRSRFRLVRSTPATIKCDRRCSIEHSRNPMSRIPTRRRRPRPRRQISPLPVDGDENSTSTPPYEELIL